VVNLVSIWDTSNLCKSVLHAFIQVQHTLFEFKNCFNITIRRKINVLRQDHTAVSDKNVTKKIWNLCVYIHLWVNDCKILMAVSVMITGCWDVIPCRLVGGYTCLGRPCCHHLQSRRSGSSFLQNFRVSSLNYVVSH